MHLSLPALLGEQYMLTAFLSETSVSRSYAAKQRGMTREVVVESLRRELMADAAAVESFVASARAKTQICFPWVAAAVELLYADGCWHTVRERLEGETLDMLAMAGRKLAGSRLCSLLQQLCQYCIFLDMEGIACENFALHHICLSGDGFTLDNTLLPGSRRRGDSQRYLRQAVELLRPFLGSSDPLAPALAELMERMGRDVRWGTLSPLWYDEELCALRARLA